MERYFGNLKTSLLIFAFDMPNVHHTSTSGLLDLFAYNLQSVSRVSPFKTKISTKFEIDTTVV